MQSPPKPKKIIKENIFFIVFASFKLLKQLNIPKNIVVTIETIIILRIIQKTPVSTNVKNQKTISQMNRAINIMLQLKAF